MKIYKVVKKKGSTIHVGMRYWDGSKFVRSQPLNTDRDLEEWRRFADTTFLVLIESIKSTPPVTVTDDEIEKFEEEFNERFLDVMGRSGIDAILVRQRIVKMIKNIILSRSNVSDGRKEVEIEKMK